MSSELSLLLLMLSLALQVLFCGSEFPAAFRFTKELLRNNVDVEVSIQWWLPEECPQLACEPSWLLATACNAL